MLKKIMANAFYAQSGGVTSVINASACGVIETARNKINKVYAGKNGIIGALREELIDTSLESIEDIANLKNTPAGAFGSCRYKLKSLTEQRSEYERLIEVFKAHDIKYFFYNGGGDSQDTTFKVSQIAAEMNYPLQCIGIPKTVDNDLPITDNCPGFGSVAKYVAVSIKEAGLDVASMAESSTKVFLLEVMGRNAGWIAAAGGLASTDELPSPHMILFPEIEFNEKSFLAKVEHHVKNSGFCTIVVSEGIKIPNVIENASVDAFGHAQLGGIAPTLAAKIKEKLGFKYHWAVADYLQRSARHIASKTDVEQAYALGQKAVELALEGKTGVMVTIERTNSSPYTWRIGETPLENVANVEKYMPRDFITEDGYHITKKCKDYLLPLIQGEAYPEYKNGLPNYVKLKNKLIEKKCMEFA